MAFPYTSRIAPPLLNYKIGGDVFGKSCVFDGKYWGRHLGSDSPAPAGTKVCAIGRGRVVYSGLHPGREILEKDGSVKYARNWGGIIIIAHKNPQTKKIFCSLYGHLGKKIKQRGERVALGEIIASIAPAMTPENGLWEEAHLHLGIYTGPYPWKKPDGKKLAVLPGYFKKGQSLTEFSWWQNPAKFLQDYPGI